MPDKAKPKFFYGYVIVAASFFIMLATFSAHYTFGVFLKPLSAEFGWTRAVTSSTWAPANLLYGLFSIPVGRLNDKFGPRLVATVCCSIMGLGYLLMSQVSAIWQLYLFLSLMGGIGLSAYVSLTSTVVRWFVKRRGIVTGIVVTSVACSVLIGPLLSNWLISAYGWRTSYTILGMVIVILAVSGAQFLKREPGQVGLAAYGAGEMETEDLSAQTEGFSFYEAVRLKQFWLVCAIWFCFGFFGIAVVIHIIPHATDMGISAAMAASILAVFGGVGIVSRLVLGSISDRIGSKLTSMFSLVLTLVALFWLIVADKIWMFYLFSIVFGFGFGGLGTMLVLVPAWLFGRSSLGLITGVVLAGWGMGATAGPIWIGYIFDITGSYQSGFLMCAALSIIGLILIVLVKPVGKEEGAIE